MNAAPYRPAVWIVVLHWNNYEESAACLESIANAKFNDTRVAFVDNGSTDGSADRIEAEYIDETEHVMIRNEENLGFARGVNVGIEEALSRGADYVLLLNNDAVLKPGSIVHLVQTAEDHDKVAAVGGIVHEGQTDEVRSAGGWFHSFRILRTCESIPEEIITETEFVPGGFALLSAEYLQQAGGYSEDYFFGFEDVDFSWRVNNSDWRLLLDSRARIFHDGAATAGNDSPFRLYHRTRNRLHFAGTEFGLVRRLTFYIFFVTSRLYLFLRWLHGHPERVHATIEGIVDHWKGTEIHEKKPECF